MSVASMRWQDKSSQVSVDEQTSAREEATLAAAPAPAASAASRAGAIPTVSVREASGDQVEVTIRGDDSSHPSPSKPRHQSATAMAESEDDSVVPDNKASREFDADGAEEAANRGHLAHLRRNLLENGEQRQNKLAEEENSDTH